LENYNPSYSTGGAADQDVIQWDLLSSGELHAFMMMGKILSARPGSLVLIDEPEISLHIEWQEELIPWFKRAAEIADCNLIITTHSPSILHNHDCTIIMLPQTGGEASQDG
jgi:predicted ATPase